MNRGSMGIARDCLIFNGAFSTGSDIENFTGQWASCRIGGVAFIGQLAFEQPKQAGAQAPLTIPPRNGKPRVPPKR